MGVFEQSLRARRFEIGRYWAYASSRIEARSFALLSQYRSGSTLLMRFLDSHPDIRCEGEIFFGFLRARPRGVLFPMAYARAGAAGHSGPVHGASLRIDQLEKCLIPALHGSPASFIGRLADRGWTFVHLKRRNALLQAVSNLIAQRRQRWQRWQLEQAPVGDERRVRIESDQLVNLTRWNERIRTQEESILASLPHTSFTYEDDLLPAHRHQETANRAFRFLGVADHPVRAVLHKMGSRSLAAQIENYDEVVDRVRQAGFGHYLEE